MAEPASDASLDFKDPSNRTNMTFAVVPLTSLDVISHQRKPSDTHVKRVIESVERIGFPVPLVVAARELGLKRVPVVIAPQRAARRMLTLNVEKEPNIRERSAVALSIYRELVEDEPDLGEDDAEVADAVQQAHYVTLGLAYKASGRLAGSLYEPILRRCDGFMDEPLADALPIRERRAG